MTVTAQNLQNLILLEIGEPLTGGPVSQSMATLWSMFADKALVAPRLQYLYVKAKAIDIKIGAIADGAFVAVGQVQQKALDDKVQTWMKERDATLTEAHRLEKQYGRVRTPVTGTLTTTAPIGPADDPRTVGGFDGNDRPYRGDALIPDYGVNRRII